MKIIELEMSGSLGISHCYVTGFYCLSGPLTKPTSSPATRKLLQCADQHRLASQSTSALHSHNKVRGHQVPYGIGKPR